MQGTPAVIEVLNEILTSELTAINQYFIHAKMLDNWGYDRLSEKVMHESIDEMKDADKLIERILYLEGVPNLQRLGNVTVGETVAEQFDLDYAVEVAAVARYNRAIELCTSEHDHGTREILEDLLRGEENHADWLESQMELIRQVGLENYLAQQIRDDD
ncbi:MAG: bacterioferritin [Acidimicrobiales bacterium]